MELKYDNLNLAFIGDIHGDFQKLQQMIKPYINTVFIVAGDCGFGFYNTKEEHITKMLKRNCNEFLEKRNLTILFIRGNHDFAPMFNKNLFSDRFKLIPDFTTVSIHGINILCIGGAVSVDRKFRTTDKDWWIDEETDYKRFVYPYEKFDIICAHTANREWIQHLLPPIPTWLKISFKEDKKLDRDCRIENTHCTLLLEEYNPKYWIHGHYHVSGRTTYKNTEIISLNCNELWEFRKDDN